MFDTNLGYKPPTDVWRQITL